LASDGYSEREKSLGEIIQVRKYSLEDMVMDSNFWKNKKVLLTGHTGFKGSWLSLWLQKLGVDLVGFSKSIPTKPSLFELADVEKNMTSIMGDITHIERITDVVKQHNPEIIIHMAAQSLVHKSYDQPLETFSTNIMGTVNLLEAIRNTSKKCVIINVTSDKCYENQELSRGYKENDPMGGYDPYSSSKGCAELITSSFRDSFFKNSNDKDYDISLASVRAGNVIGGGDWADNRIMPDIMRGILNKKIIKIRNPTAVRPWQHVLEPLRGYLELAEKLYNYKSEYTESWNFGPDDDDVKPVSWIVNKVVEMWGEDVQVDFDDDRLDYKHETSFLRLDCSKAKSKLKWNPKIKLEEGLKLTVNWYKQYEQTKELREFTENQIEEYAY
jgi:CDP-glucose 4,6-dehydratase